MKLLQNLTPICGKEFIVILEMTTPGFSDGNGRKIFFIYGKNRIWLKKSFDQCGIVMYLDSENWLKASIEYENQSFQHLGSVVTNNGYSDWATTEIHANVKSVKIIKALEAYHEEKTWYPKKRRRNLNEIL